MGRKTGVLLSNVLMVAEILSTLLFTPYLIRTLGQAEYGVYTLALSVTAYLTLLDLGVGNAVVKYSAQFRARQDGAGQRRFLGAATLYYAAVAAVAALAGAMLIVHLPALFGKGLTPAELVRARQLMLLTVANVVVTLLAAAYRHILSAYERFVVTKGLAIVQVLVRIGAGVIVLWQGGGSLGIVTVNLLLTVILNGLYVLYVLGRLKLRPVFTHLDPRFLREVFAYSSVVLLQMVATQVNQLADTVMIGALVTSASGLLAVYGVASQINSYFQTIGSGFSGVLMPGVVRLIERGGEPRVLLDEMVRIGRLILMALGIVWAGFVVFGRQFLVLWSGPANADAYPVALLLMTPQLFIQVQAIGSQMLWAKNKHRKQAAIKAAVVAVNIAVSVILIRWNPLLGAAIGTCASLVLGDMVCMAVVFRWDLKIPIGEYYRRLLSRLAPVLAVTVLAGYLFRLLGLSGWRGLIINIAVMCAVYAGLLWLCGMNTDEKRLARTLLGKLRRRLPQIHQD